MACNNCDNLFTNACAMEGSTIVLMARMYDANSVLLTQALTSSIRVDVYDVTTTDVDAIDSSGVEITDGTAYATPNVATTIYDTLQTTGWDADTTGFNMAWNFVPPVKDRTYDVRIKVTTVSGDPLIAAYKIKSR